MDATKGYTRRMYTLKTLSAYRYQRKTMIHSTRDVKSHDLERDSFQEIFRNFCPITWSTVRRFHPAR